MSSPPAFHPPLNPSLDNQFRKSLWLLGFLVLAFLPAAVGMMFPPDLWYASLHKPAWNPPAAVFAPVWTLLYLTMGAAGWLVWRRAGWSMPTFQPYLVQLLLNMLWTPVFFGLHAPMTALIVSVALAASILWTMRRFATVSSAAALLLLPYLGWVAFATVLTAWIAFHNL